VTLTAPVDHGGPLDATTPVNFVDDTAPLHTKLLGSATVDPTGGTAHMTVSFAAAGTYHVVADYQGDATFLPSQSADTAITVDPAGTTTSLVIQPTMAAVNQTVTFTATVQPGSGTLDANTSVDFVNNTDPNHPVTLGTATVDPVNGEATLQLSFPSPTTISVVAVYEGDTNFATSTSTPKTLQV